MSEKERGGDGDGLAEAAHHWQGYDPRGHIPRKLEEQPVYCYA
jgi:hypothetical protein